MSDIKLEPRHALMLDGLAQCYENEASIGPKSKAQYAAINAEACHAGAQAVRAALAAAWPTKEQEAEWAARVKPPFKYVPLSPSEKLPDPDYGL